jgi:UDP-N-acetylmuramoylalanine--D-glutamate ligase
MSPTMAPPELAERQPDLRDLRVLVLGLGRSGLAAARLARAGGARVTVADARSEETLGPLVRRTRDEGIAVLPGGHPATLAGGADLLIVSPGVPVETAIVREARERGLPVWGEVELAARHCRGRVVGVTGSNGKSTVTSMIGRILREAGIPGGTGGNLDVPFAELLTDDGVDAIHAVELSSFQLETTETLRADVALVVNLSPDHLDRHATYDAYAEAKARLLDLQGETAEAILNADDPDSRRFRERVRGRLHEFSTRRDVERGAFLRYGRLTVRSSDGDRELMAAEDLTLRGEHNVANALAAALACSLVGCPAEAIAGGLRGFRSLPHRLEPIATLDGVEYFNDSKATNPASALLALRSFGSGTVHLILGGKDKGADWTELCDEAVRRARNVLLVGSAAAGLRKRFGDRVKPIDCGTIPEAVRTAASDASPGDVVLLSPGCASFDQYDNFEQRGEDFRRAVDALAGGEDGDA